MRKVSQADLDALNHLVQDGLIEVVSIDEFGEPSYRLASRFTAEHVARTEGSPGVRGSAPVPKPDVCSVRRRALPVSVGRPSPDPAGAVKGAEGERSDPLTAPAMLLPRPTEGVPPKHASGGNGSRRSSSGRRSSGKLPRS
jgi:hypothetical protein